MTTENSMNLAQLIQAHRDRTGESFSQIAARGGLSKSKIGQIAIDGRHMPRLDTVDRLADALQLPRHIIQRAAMATAGLVPDDDSGVTENDLIANQITQLDPAEKNVVLRLVEVLLEQKKDDDAKA